MPKGAAWPPDATAETFAEHDYPDFAQEFLRRNPDYRRDYRRIMRRMADGAMTPRGASEAVSKWGLVFRLQPGPAPLI